VNNVPLESAMNNPQKIFCGGGLKVDEVVENLHFSIVNSLVKKWIRDETRTYKTHPCPYPSFLKVSRAHFESESERTT